MGHAAAAFDEGILVVGGRNRNQLRDAIDYVPFDGTATRLSSRLRAGRRTGGSKPRRSGLYRRWAN